MLGIVESTYRGGRCVGKSDRPMFLAHHLTLLYLHALFDNFQTPHSPVVPGSSPLVHQPAL